MRVRIRWADEREGTIHDIAGFEPAEPTPDAVARPTDAGRAGDADQVEVVTTPIRIAMTYRPGEAAEPFLLGTQRRELLGRRCSQCEKVYLPPRGVCSMCGAAFTDEQVECGPNGTVATFLVVNVPFASQEIDPPYTAVEVLFDGAHITSQFLLLGTPVEDVRIGMRVRAVWDDADELDADAVQRHPRRGDRRTGRPVRGRPGLRLTAAPPPPPTPGKASRMRDVAIVSFSQAAFPETRLNEPELLLPVLDEVAGRVGLEKTEIGFTCSGSSDYLAGAPFSFVAALDAVGPWPPIAESHVEMDGAWALYEAWLWLQAGDADTALVYAFGKTSPSDVSRTLALQLEPVHARPAVPRQPRAGRPAGPGPARRRARHRGVAGRGRGPGQPRRPRQPVRRPGGGVDRRGRARPGHARRPPPGRPGAPDHRRVRSDRAGRR